MIARIAQDRVRRDGIDEIGQAVREFVEALTTNCKEEPIFTTVTPVKSIREEYNHLNNGTI
jgi:hypothetical protein